MVTWHKIIMYHFGDRKKRAVSAKYSIIQQLGVNFKQPAQLNGSKVAKQIKNHPVALQHDNHKNRKKKKK